MSLDGGRERGGEGREGREGEGSEGRDDCYTYSDGTPLFI